MTPDMDSAAPSRHLKKRRCPCDCGGEGYLVLSACPACRGLLLECDELGTVFPDPRDLSRDMEWTLDPALGLATFACPHSGKPGLRKLEAATDGEIQAAGFRRTDYE